MSDGAEIKFSEAALAEYRELLTHYPTRQAALLPTLWIAQREFGWLSGDAQLYVAKLMELPPAHVRAVVTFYTMFYQHPVGKWHIGSMHQCLVPAARRRPNRRSDQRQTRHQGGRDHRG